MVQQDTSTTRGERLAVVIDALTRLREEAREVDPDNWWLQASELITLGYAHLAVDISDAIAEQGMPADVPVLDWGAGPGYLTYALEALGHNITYYDFKYENDAFDFVLHRLRAEKIYVGEELVGLPFADASFGAVISFGVLEHVPDMPGSVAEVMRVLRPGGLFFVYHFPNRFSWTEGLAALLGRVRHDVKLTRGQLRRVVAVSGTEALETSYRYLLPRNLTDMPRLRGWMSRHARGVYRFDSALTKVPLLRLLSTTHNLVVRKRHE